PPASETRAAVQQEPAHPSGNLRASPLARKLAYERGVDLRAVSGSGPGGRVVKRDIEQAQARAPAAPPPAAKGSAPTTPRPQPAPGTPPAEDQVVALSP